LYTLNSQARESCLKANGCGILSGNLATMGGRYRPIKSNTLHNDISLMYNLLLSWPLYCDLTHPKINGVYEKNMELQTQS